MSQQSVSPGDPFGMIKGVKGQDNLPSADVVNRFHTKADTDSNAGAAHHTLGVKHDQAAPGDHIHNGINSHQLLENAVLTGAKGGNVALANLITMLSNALGFTDSTT